MSSAKKGWAGGDASMAEKFGAHWYYTWGTGGRNSTTKEFVPMIKGAHGLGQLGAVEGQQGISHLLGYNEPERSKDVERYANFEPGKGKAHSLMKADGSLSRMGELYKAAGT